MRSQPGDAVLELSLPSLQQGVIKLRQLQKGLRKPKQNAALTLRAQAVQGVPDSPRACRGWVNPPQNLSPTLTSSTCRSALLTGPTLLLSFPERFGLEIPAVPKQ